MQKDKYGSSSLPPRWHHGVHLAALTRACMCVYPALVTRTWRHFGSETQLLKGTQPLVRKSLKGLKTVQERKFSADSVSLDLVWVCQEPLYLWAFVLFLGREELRLGRGALQCLLEPFSVTFCCFWNSWRSSWAGLKLRCLFKKRRKKVVIVCGWLRDSVRPF